MQRLSYTNSTGLTVRFHEAAPYVFWKIDGVGNPAVRFNETRTIGQNGFTPMDITAEARTVSLYGHVHGVSGIPEFYKWRRSANAVMSPMLAPGFLTYETDFGRWVIPAVPDEPEYGDKMKNIQTFVFRFICPDPLWRSADAEFAHLSYGTGAFMFPMEFDVEFGMISASTALFNGGDAPTPVEFWIEGGGINPAVTNETTGQSFSVIKNFAATNTLYINTVRGGKAVRVLDSESGVILENAFGYLAPQSVLFSLVPGVNKLKFKSDSEKTTTKIRVRWWNRYTGI